MPTPFKTVLAVTLLLAAGHAQAADSLAVPLGSAIPVRLDRPAAQVIVGNPAVADVTVHSPRHLTLFGKSASATTLTVLGADGKVLMDAAVVVEAGSANSLGIIYASGKNVPVGGQRMAVECAAGACAMVR